MLLPPSKKKQTNWKKLIRTGLGTKICLVFPVIAVLVWESASVEAAKQQPNSLPLVEAGLQKFELLPLRPLAVAQNNNPQESQEDVTVARDIVPSEVVASLPKGNFLENITVGPDGAFYITSYVAREILRYHPDDRLRRFAGLDVYPIGIDFDTDGTAYISAHRISLLSRKDFRSSNVIYKMDTKGRAELWKAVKDAKFLNGVLSLSPGQLAIADSAAGVIWKVNVKEKTVEPWIHDQRLEPVSPSSHTPAANGLKIFNKHLYISNLDRQTLMRASISESGDVGKLEMVYENIPIDDFAFSENGTLYTTTHEDTVLRTRPNGERQVIAGTKQGVLGNTAVVFGQTKADLTKLYVIGDGGLAAGGELQPANIVRLEVKEKGYDNQ